MIIVKISANTQSSEEESNNYWKSLTHRETLGAFTTNVFLKQISKSHGVKQTEMHNLHTWK